MEAAGTGVKAGAPVAVLITASTLGSPTPALRVMHQLSCSSDMHVLQLLCLSPHTQTKPPPAPSPPPPTPTPTTTTPAPPAGSAGLPQRRPVHMMQVRSHLCVQLQ